MPSDKFICWANFTQSYKYTFKTVNNKIFMTHTSIFFDSLLISVIVNSENMILIQFVENHLGNMVIPWSNYRKHKLIPSHNVGPNPVIEVWWSYLPSVMGLRWASNRPCNNQLWDPRDVAVSHGRVLRPSWDYTFHVPDSAIAEMKLRHVAMDAAGVTKIPERWWGRGLG